MQIDLRSGASLSARRLSRCGSRARSCARARPRRSARPTRGGIASPIVSPIASDTSRPTRSSSASGPIGWPAPSRMQVSMSVGVHAGLFEQPHRAEQVREQQAVDDEARARRAPPRAVFSNASHSASARLRVSSLAARGKISSTSFICVTGLNTCRPRKRSGRPLACASRSTDSEEVVLARIASRVEHAVQLGQQRRP